MSVTYDPARHEMTPSDKRDEMLKAMRALSNQLYPATVRIGCHALIEFNGLINAYIEACQQAHDAGIDFTACNTHTGVELPMADHAVDYVAEKLACIYSGRMIIDRSAPPGESAAELLLTAYAKGQFTGSVDWDDVDGAFEAAKAQVPGRYQSIVRQVNAENIEDGEEEAEVAPEGESSPCV